MLRMKDRLGSFSNNANMSRNNGSSGKKLCWKYNQGKCTYGFNCKFDHRCGICGKTGHGAHICRKGKHQENNGVPPAYDSGMNASYGYGDDKHRRSGGNHGGHGKGNHK